MAQTLNDQGNLSYAWGYLGQLYESQSRFSEALTLTRRAALAAQSLPESLYLWQWQTGRLLVAMQQATPALAAYGRAIETVQAIRAALLQRLRREHNAFRLTLGPLYFEYADLLLQQADALQASEDTEVNTLYETYLHRARDAVEQFKTQELREYFGDECVDVAHEQTVTVDQVSSDAVIIYPILLPERTELLVSVAREIKRVVLPVTRAQLEQRVHIFRNALEARDPRRYLRHAQRLYMWLIQPLEPHLQAHHMQTIVFVPDGTLRLLPVAALHDGNQYLIEKYAVAITPSLRLTKPQSLPRGNLDVLAAGLSESMAGLPALPHVASEVRNLEQLYSATVLLDQDFSPERLEQTVQQGDFGIVHIAAHGHFASNAAESFLLTGKGKLSFEQLTQIVGRLRFRKQPLELLTLSACETAQGDDRAALGLAGIAIQAGARSAVATLWQVRDTAATLLMTRFYQHLQNPAMSRAQALQQAQLALLKHSDYTMPFFWAPFLLINNWL
jgi:CHAT domain-containing protein